MAQSPLITNNVKKNTNNVQSDESQSHVVNEVIKKRKRASQRCGYQAITRIKRTPANKWAVYNFLEKHNHRLVREEDYKYLKVARDVANLGPTRAWKVFKEMYGGFENIGVTLRVVVGTCSNMEVVENELVELGTCSSMEVMVISLLMVVICSSMEVAVISRAVVVISSSMVRVET
ncbi:protein FAR1-RELATED SEQUENCE 5 [Artemisia annua]|uniref:Protein FAR1-RELATED SEQUENCE 5 n=1 Tax=Artemisia annua TaxID=35608 RepID=A0A2U1P561_ARTAN|nr:protein FAR1-RELATED SEQUENCE 5 [Artemisia annua]